MCTSLALNTPDFYFGRNLDLECSFGEQVVITPRRYPIAFRKAAKNSRHYAFIGMAAIVDGYPLYADAMNEMGLAAAGLNFPGNAWYSPNEEYDKLNISPFELIPWLLSRCKDLCQARSLLAKTHLTAIPFRKGYPLSPLHWHIADETGSIVLEATRQGMRIYDNPAGVLTNNPPFDFHMTNLNQYMNLTPGLSENHFSPSLSLSAFGRGMGAIGLPGDYSPASRFVRAAFLRGNSVCENTVQSAVTQFFHLLDNVSMPSGSVRLEENRLEITRYSCCMQKNGLIFYYKTYDNNQITAVDMLREDLNAEQLIAYPLCRKQQIQWINR